MSFSSNDHFRGLGSDGVPRPEFRLQMGSRDRERPLLRLSRLIVGFLRSFKVLKSLRRQTLLSQITHYFKLFDGSGTSGPSDGAEALRDQTGDVGPLAPGNEAGASRRQWGVGPDVSGAVDSLPAGSLGQVGTSRSR